MASLIPAIGICVSRMTGGEKRLAQSLEQKLEDDWLLWYDVPLGPRKDRTASHHFSLEECEADPYSCKLRENMESTNKVAAVISIANEYQRRVDLFLAKKEFKNYLPVMLYGCEYPHWRDEAMALWREHVSSVPWEPAVIHVFADFHRHLFFSMSEDCDGVDSKVAEKTHSASDADKSESPLKGLNEVDLALSEAIKSLQKLKTDPSPYGSLGACISEPLLEFLQAFGEHDPGTSLAKYEAALFPASSFQDVTDGYEGKTYELDLLFWNKFYADLVKWVISGGLGCNGKSTFQKGGENADELLSPLTWMVAAIASFSTEEGHWRFFLRSCEALPQPVFVAVLRSALNTQDKSKVRHVDLLRLLRFGIGSPAVSGRPFIPWGMVGEILTTFWELTEFYYGKREQGLLKKAVDILTDAVHDHFSKGSRGSRHWSTAALGRGRSPINIDTLNGLDFWYSTAHQDPDSLQLVSDPPFLVAIGSMFINFYMGEPPELILFMPAFRAARDNGYLDFCVAFTAFFIFDHTLRNKGQVEDWGVLNSVIRETVEMPGGWRVRKACALAAKVAEAFEEPLFALLFKGWQGEQTAEVINLSAYQGMRQRRNETESRLRSELGDVRWGRLDPQARNLLTDAEMHFSQNAAELGSNTFSDWGPVATLYVRALEAQIVTKMLPVWESAALLAHFQTLGRRRDSKPTLGPLLHLLKGFDRLSADLRDAIEISRINLQYRPEMVKKVLDLMDIRNRGSHANTVSDQDVLRVRSVLLKDGLLAQIIDLMDLPHSSFATC